MFFFDPLYFIILAPAFILSMIAQIWVKSAYTKYSQVFNSRRISGAAAADYMLKTKGITDVKIELASGFLGDHYDPRNKTLRLSADNYNGQSIAAVGVACHEAGHAIQHAYGYAPLKLRTALVPITMLGSNLAWPLLIVGFLFHALSLIKLGILFFSGAVLFQLVTLPVEFDASHRALVAIRETGLLRGEEVTGAKRVLQAAAMTYVAAAAAAILQLIYFLLRAGLLGNRED
ncbi:Peptidase, membrane zinc metallopeptidase, putative [Candidatus Desulfofervidus auxilii]|uniref:Peptidase, membrane zinc metallopeptidase, putative n=2 Tax=Desulfofervidus auxilii TaxID=1621989 RepID=A0A7U4THG0_DESA2|nr:zinc metallopeptidase [Candidatus Desulfofervidus auxilii]AMM41804.1 Peptidase, membrane zinc metallopeptidase, putative [Candidatus Desulfofervidus auxilii]